MLPPIRLLMLLPALVLAASCAGAGSDSAELLDSTDEASAQGTAEQALLGTPTTSYAVGAACAATADCAAGEYCEIGPGWTLSSFALDHTCQPVASPAIATVSSCALPQLASVTATNLTYTSAGWQCSVYQPATGTGLPVVLVLPYGGFLSQFRLNPDMINYAKAIVSTGKVAAVCDYTKATSTLSGVPLEISDVRCAIRTFGTTAGGLAFTAAGGGTYRGDSSRLGVVGSSAGGSLALVAALTADQAALKFDSGTISLDSGTCNVAPLAGGEVGLIKRLIGAAPPTDMPGPYGYGTPTYPTNLSRLAWYAGTTEEPARVAALTAVSPALADMAHPYPGAPPVLLIQSSGDTTVAPAQTATMDEALEAHGFQHSRILVPTLYSGTTNVSHPWPFNLGGVAAPAQCTGFAFLAGL
ncbi:MAG: alpha/beta hydrolase [Byssovorax sp.]